MNARLNSKGEELWQELRQHLDWNDGFALFFLFASNTQLTDIFKYRLERFFIGKTTRLQEITYQTDDSDWLEHTMLKLLNRDAQWRLLHAPVWIALHHTQDAQALTQYRQLLLRLNERRDVWRNAYPAPMIFVLPEVLKSEIARLIPDLWSVRIATEHWDESLLQVDSVSGGAQQPSVPVGVLTDAGRCAIPDVQQPVVDEWQRLLSKNGKIQRQHLIVASRALAVYQRYGWLADAQQAAALMEEWARELNQTDTPESLRDLSVSLDNVGKVGQQQGRWGDAQSAYEESLGIRRRLCAMLGDTPESLRDLSVSLNMVGQVGQQQGRWGDAQSAYEESLGIRRRLCAMLGDTPESLRDLSVSLNMVGQVGQQQGRWGDAQSAYEESLGISRRLCAMLGDTPESLRDLSVSLLNMGGLYESFKKFDKAMLCYQESLSIGERLIDISPDAPSYLEIKNFSQIRLVAIKHPLIFGILQHIGTYIQFLVRKLKKRFG